MEIYHKEDKGFIEVWLTNEEQETCDRKELTELLQPRIVIPMHFRQGDLGLGAIAELDAFTSLYPAAEVSLPGSNTLKLTEDSPKGVIVLQYQ